MTAPDPGVTASPAAPAGPVRPSAPNLSSVTTIATDGSRPFLHPADVTGRFTHWRRVTAAVLIVIYLALPWIPVGGSPALFLDFGRRRFHFFGWVLAAQDTWLLFFLLTGVGFGLFFLTALFGRVWCGWACPQTVFLEHVYRPIERWIEGDARARRALDTARWTADKLIRRGATQALFVLVSLVIAHLFLAYFVSIPELWHMMRSAPGEHWGAFLFVFISAAGLYFNFAWFREQMCIVICPYGRLQSALSDDHTMTIGYDERRGEPRAKLGKKNQVLPSTQNAGLGERGQVLTLIQVAGDRPAAPAFGDCIACNRCVQVCPTGIDIRQGLQLECIGCANCIDACDAVMARLRKPAGLIRYDSQVGLAGGRTRWLRPRTIAYAVLLLVGATVATFAFSSVQPASLSVVRITGASYFVDAGTVRNQFFVRIVNKSPDAASFTVAVEAPGVPLNHTGVAGAITVPGLGENVVPLVALVDRARYSGPFRFTIRLRDAAGVVNLQREVEFLGPDVQLLGDDDREKGIRR